MDNIFNVLKRSVDKDCLGYVGAVRGNHMLVLFNIPDSLASSFNVSLITVLSGSDTFGIEILDESLLNVDVKKSSSIDGGLLVSCKVSLEDFTVTDDVRFIYNGCEICCMDDRYSLSSLVHHDYREFQKRFSFAASRVVDEETVRYIARNNILYSKAFSGTVKVTSFSIYLYKSLSMGVIDHEEIDTFFDIAKDSIEVFSEEEATSLSIRSDVVGRAISITLAYCHYMIGYGELLKVKQLFFDLVSFSERAVQPQGKKTELEDHSYLYSKLICIALLASWSDKDFLFFNFLKKKLIEVYGYASKKSVDFPYVYLKEFGETYSLYLKYKLVFQKDAFLFGDIFDLAKTASRVKSEIFLDRVFERLSDLSEVKGSTLNMVCSGLMPTLMKNTPTWQDFNPIDSGKYLFKASFLSEHQSAKGCIFCIKSKVGQHSLIGDNVRGLSLSPIEGLGFFKYIRLEKGESFTSFEFEIDGVFLDQCAIFIWDKSVGDATCISFDIREILS